MIVDEQLPHPEFSTSHHILVHAYPEETFDAIGSAPLGSDRIMAALVAARLLPQRVAAVLRAERLPPQPRSFTFDDIGRSGDWVLLGERVGEEQVVGAVGRFWGATDFGFLRIDPDDFRGFHQPGYAKTIAAFSVRPYGEGRTLLSYESRTTTTDAGSHKRFRRYWRIIRPGADILMRRALKAIKAHAEARHAPPPIQPRTRRQSPHDRRGARNIHMP